MSLDEMINQLAEKGLCLEMQPSIAGQDTDFYEYYCTIKDGYGEHIRSFDYFLDKDVHGYSVRIPFQGAPDVWLNPTNIDEIQIYT